MNPSLTRSTEETEVMECHEIESEVFSKDRRLGTTIPQIDLHQYRPAGAPGEAAAVVILKVGEDKTVQSKYVSSKSFDLN